MTSSTTCPKCGTALLDDALEGLCQKCLANLAFASLPDGSPLCDEHLPLRRLGDYELIEEIARGGMGVVYKARQMSLNRIVAVKVVLHGPFSSEQFVRRFHTEAEAAAALHHPNIVSIYEVGEHNGHYFLSMEYIEGKNLADLVKEGPLSARRAGAYVKTVAEAVQYAHEHGILHRDLKPSNLLLDTFDQPRVTDFGLAKLLNSDTELTMTGQVLGSPNHIPPEQAAGKFSQATVQSDVYSLGAILYHLVTGRPPFQGETLQDILLQAQNAEPVPPRRLNPSVPENLQTICLKCLQKEPSRRYGSAQELADNLGRFLDGRPIQARPVALAEKFWLWCRRRPVLAALSAALLVAVALGLAGILWQWRRAERHAQGEANERLLVEKQAARVRLNLYAADVSLASQAIQHSDYGLARRTLAALCPKHGQPDLRGFEWRYLWNLCRGSQLATLTGHEWIVTCAAFSPDGKLAATGSQDGTAKVWSVERQSLVATLRGEGNGAVWSVGFSPDGKLLMTAGQGEVRLWNTATWQTTSRLPGELAALSKTGWLIAVSQSSPFYYESVGRVSLWNYRTGERLRQFDKPGRSPALSPDGHKLAVVGAGNGVELLDADTGKLLRTLATDEPVWSLNFSPDGNRLLASGWSSEVLLWNLAAGGPPKKLKGHSLTVWSASFSPDDSTIATAGSDQTICLWDADTLRLKGALRGHDSEVWCASFSPDGKLLVSGGKDKNVMLWSTEISPARQDLPNVDGTRPVFSPDGDCVITTVGPGGKPYSAVWNVKGGSLLAEYPLGHALGFSPDGSQVISWDASQSGLEFRSFRALKSRAGILPARVSEADAPLSVTRSRGGQDARPTFEAPAHNSGSRFQMSEARRDLATARVSLSGIESCKRPFIKSGLSPDSKQLFAIDQTGVVFVWNIASGKLIGSLQGPEPPIRNAILGPGGKYFAISVERENEVRLYEVATSKLRRLSGHHDFVSGLAFSPDGQTFASGSVDGTIRLWDTATGEQTAMLPGHIEEATDVAFSPDGRTLASLGHKESLKLWHLPTRRELFSLAIPSAGLYLTFSPDGSHLAVTTEENSVRLFDAPTPEESDLSNH